MKKIKLKGKNFITVTPDLNVLIDGSNYRGCVDAYQDGVLSGWCISTTNPLAELTLEILVGEVSVGFATVCHERKDIARMLGFPLRAGFTFDLKKCHSKALDNVLKTLAAESKHEAPHLLSTVVSVIVEEGIKLSVLPLVTLTREQLNSLAFTISQQAVGISRNTATPSRATLRTAFLAKSEKSSKLNLVAYYLPQFHPFAENNEWWGDGFTEWTNVTSAKPNYPAHDQPRFPADLGYYDLRLGEVHQKQVDLAKAYGVTAFCYHYYWFSGTNLMTMPIDRHVNENLDLDFCLCWANENWSRRWDGSEADVLMMQQHASSDDADFIHSVLPYFAHPRYLRIEGKPMLVIYRVSLLDNPAQTFAKWREVAKQAGFVDIHISVAESFGISDPYAYGADSSCQFPPHGVAAKDISSQVVGLSSNFSGKIYDYDEVAANEIWREQAPHLQFRGIFPAWDNTARKGLASHIFRNASPAVFETWLSYLIADANERLPETHRIIFINAWNEWAEGAYLEPDKTNGHAYLHALRRAKSSAAVELGRLLIDCKNDGFTGDAATILEAYRNIENSNNQLFHLAQRSPSRTIASPFIRLTTDLVSHIAPASGQIKIDLVNGRSAANKVFTVIRQQHLSLRGWIRIPDRIVSAFLPLFAKLTPIRFEKGTDSYVSAIHEREMRPDVAAAFQDHGSEQWYGFSLNGDLTLVTPGSYSVGIMVPSSTDSDSAITLNTVVILHIG